MDIVHWRSAWAWGVRLEGFFLRPALSHALSGPPSGLLLERGAAKVGVNAWRAWQTCRVTN